MSVLEPNKRRAQDVPNDQTSQPEHGGGHSGHSHWLMIACCIPMLAIAIVLVAAGVASAGFIVVALACTLMMAMMMIGMSGGRSGDRSGS